MAALDAARRLASAMVGALDQPQDDLPPSSDSRFTLLVHAWRFIGSFSTTTLFGLGLVISVTLLLLCLWHKHRTARRLMEGGRCNLPTVLWRPKFINYAPERDDLEDIPADATPPYETRKKMTSSSITNMLPRMERLGGPYGMYGTIYGLSTRVVHVGHPVPAKAIISGMGSASSAASNRSMSTRRSSPKAGRKRASLYVPSSGATKSPAYDHFKGFSGDGVFTADGEDWKVKRASVIHCLLRGCTSDKSEGMRRLQKEANHAANGFIRSIEQERQRLGDNKEPDVCLNVVPLLQKSTIGLIYRFITHHDVDLSRVPIHGEENGGSATATRRTSDRLSCELDSLLTITPKSSSASLCSLAEVSPKSNGEGDRDDKTTKTANSAASLSSTETSSVPSRLLASYLMSVTHIRMIILAQSRSFWFLVPRWVYRAFSPMFRAEENTMVPIRDFARAACLNAQPDSPLALLRDRPSHGGPNSDPAHVSKNMMDEAITLLFAGQDTSAATLSWTLHLLSLYPDVQEKLAKEVRCCVQKQRGSGEVMKTDGAFFTKQFISNMPYLDAVLKESMRLYPVAPFVVRKVPQDTTIPPESKLGSSTVLPEGTLACIWIYALHRNPRLWHRPNDFVPERWIDPQIKNCDEGQRSGAFMPFANGPRNCVGQPLAHVILRIILARIVDTYNIVDKRLEAMSVDDVVSRKDTAAMDLRKDMQAGFTVLPSGGLRLTLRQRGIIGEVDLYNQ